MFRNWKFVTLVLIGLAIGAYVFFQGYDLIRGPLLEIQSPAHLQTFEQSAIEIIGTAENISFIYLNDTQIFVDPEGTFSEKLLLLPGYNIITVRATDKFNREVRRELHLILENKE